MEYVTMHLCGGLLIAEDPQRRGSQWSQEGEVPFEGFETVGRHVVIGGRLAHPVRNGSKGAATRVWRPRVSLQRAGGGQHLGRLPDLSYMYSNFIVWLC